MNTRPIRFFHRGQVVRSTVLRQRARCSTGCARTRAAAAPRKDATRATAAPARWSSAEIADAGDAAGAVRGLALKTVNACIEFLPTLDGKALFTVDDLEKKRARRRLHPAQQAIVDCHGSQCGFCTPDFVMALAPPTTSTSGRWRRAEPRQQLADELSGNLCRCTGYRPILDAGERMFATAGARSTPRPCVAALPPLRRKTRRLAPQRRRFHAPRTLDELAALRPAAPRAAARRLHRHRPVGEQAVPRVATSSTSARSTS